MLLWLVGCNKERCVIMVNRIYRSVLVFLTFGSKEDY